MLRSRPHRRLDDLKQDGGEKGVGLRAQTLQNPLIKEYAFTCS